MEKTVKTRDLAEVDAEIKAAKEALENVHGKETEVYARIVGYYRAVRNWNKGKAEEFKHRKMFSVDNVPEAMPQDAAEKEKVSAPVKTAAGDLHYDFFFRQTCPNCPPVKAYMADLSVSGKSINVDTKEGLAQAAAKGVFAAPTVIVYNENGKEVARAHNVQELSAIFEPVALAV
ncbi:hypothetical protein HRI96_05210 [Treponema parvum]|uniref:Glutaredoxin n=1 Tax=Treponema parvum TaxID=138851 RepID=A0A975IC87_9SPIR|nr:anaerobic ribonucleoside-triphosphate reductase [Treponema parvum]QTQ11655.1 hypothetical protein HRI96_05210 [Treponema parvum]QTQ16402.1 hypothetical protein HXT04_06715 [Treponema parvum]